MGGWVGGWMKTSVQLLALAYSSSFKPSFLPLSIHRPTHPPTYLPTQPLLAYSRALYTASKWVGGLVGGWAVLLPTYLTAASLLAGPLYRVNAVLATASHRATWVGEWVGGWVDG